MEDLIAQFTFLSDQALSDKSFDPSAIEGLMKLFEVEAYKSWAEMELSCSEEAEEARNSIEEAEDYLDSAMESAVEELRWFEEVVRTTATELSSLVQRGDNARKLGSSMEKAATVASEMYVGAATSSAVASMRASSKKVYPS